jgi:hypothetical protein
MNIIFLMPNRSFRKDIVPSSVFGSTVLPGQTSWCIGIPSVMIRPMTICSFPLFLSLEYPNNRKVKKGPRKKDVKLCHAELKFEITYRCRSCGKPIAVKSGRAEQKDAVRFLTESGMWEQ